MFLNLVLASSGRIKIRTAIAPQYWASIYANSTSASKQTLHILCKYHVRNSPSLVSITSQLNHIRTPQVPFYAYVSNTVSSLLVIKSAFPPFPICAACPQPSHRPLIILKTFIVHTKLTLFILSSSPLQSPAASTLLRPHIFLSLCSSLTN